MDNEKVISFPTPAWVGAEISDCNCVFEGGAMRGQFTAGVTDFWMEKKFFPRHIFGTSAGALVGACYAAGIPERACMLNVKYCNDPRYLSFSSFVRTGNVCGREFAFDEIPHHLEPLDIDAYNDSPVKVSCVCSNLETGEADYPVLEDYERDIRYLIATSSMPLVSQIVEVDGQKYLDGGTCDSIAITESQLRGPKKQVVVLTQAADYRKQPNRLMALLRQRYADYPYFLERAEHRHIEYNRTVRKLNRMHESGEIFLIRPQKPIEVSNMEKDPEKLIDLYAQGYAEGMRTWTALQTYLAQ